MNHRFNPHSKQLRQSAPYRPEELKMTRRPRAIARPADDAELIVTVALFGLLPLSLAAGVMLYHAAAALFG